MTRLLTILLFLTACQKEIECPYQNCGPKSVCAFQVTGRDTITVSPNDPTATWELTGIKNYWIHSDSTYDSTFTPQSCDMGVFSVGRVWCVELGREVEFVILASLVDGAIPNVPKDWLIVLAGDYGPVWREPGTRFDFGRF